MNQALPQEILIQNLDDPTRVYSVKDAETFYRVYGRDSRYIIASGPDMDADLKAHFESLTPNLPLEEKGIEIVQQAPAEVSAETPPVSSGSPEF